MSLILEALRKREREKQVPERGFLVVAPAAWAEQRGRRMALGVTAVLVAFALGASWSAWWRPAAATTAEPPRPHAQAPVAASALRTVPDTLLPPPTTPTTVHVLTAASPLVASAAEPTPVPVTPTTIAAAPAAPVLQAISERNGRRVALINDRLMQEGDEFGGMRVIAIRESEVELEIGGARSVLHF